MTKKSLFLPLLLASVAFAADGITENEKRAACRSIIETLDYDTGVSVALCMSGEWIVSDVEEGRGNRQVAFEWKGRLSEHQGGEDQCMGYVVSRAGSGGRLEVIDLDCK